MIKDIVVSLSADEATEVAGDYAVSLGALFDAHVTAVGFAFVPIVPQTPLMDALGVDLISSQVGQNRKSAEAAIARFEQGLAREGVRGASLLYESGVAEAADLLGAIARRFDLAVVSQADPRSNERQILIEGVLFGSGRPVIVVPYIQTQPVELDRVLLCWDGSRSSARAAGDAMPLLARAGRVDVLTVAGEPPKSEEVEGADIGEHLARHGLKVEVNRLTIRDGDVASAILSYAADSNATFAVMGGFGHSRLREFVLGGTTRGMLAAMTVPVLMSH
jgi:nucleotide-binding universal stress UspA family protein